MRVGIVGVGFMGSTHAAGWQETGAELVGFAAETVEEAQPVAQQFGVRVYRDLAELLKDVDVVDICTPTHLHHPMVLQAAEAKKHIICEKPLALDIKKGQEMISACQKAGVQLLVAHVVRFFPEYVLAKQTVDEGKIGKIGSMRLQRGAHRPKKAAGNWFLDENKSGGMMFDLMIHDFDYARWVAGEVESVYARRITQAYKDAPVDYGMAILKHRSGALTHVAGAWAYPPPTFRTSFEISGDGGMIDYDSVASTPIVNLLQKSGDENAPDVALPSSPLSESPYATQLKEFYAVLNGQASARVTAADALAAVQISLAAIESTISGRAVRVEPLKEVLK